jgi:superfamily II DNA/RNA helicase
MKPEENSQKLLQITRSKAKMNEYSIDEKYQDIDLSYNHPDEIFFLAIGTLGDYSNAIINNYKNKTAEISSNLKESLSFVARFFDAYIESGLTDKLNSYLNLLGAATYYLSDQPGNCKVLVNNYQEPESPIDSLGLYQLLFCILNNDLEDKIVIKKSLKEFIKKILNCIKKGENVDKIQNIISRMRNIIYNDKGPREVLLIDIISAVLIKKYRNSCWITLPKYTKLDRNLWSNTILKSSFIEEFWPAQHLLGKYGVFSGKSAVIQMPTSAGKTKSIEIVIRSSFLSNRSKNAIIVAPFRALCKEIENTLSDAFVGEKIKINILSESLELDFDNIFELDKQIIVLTPEKLLYILKQTPNLSNALNLVIFDEAHQFDNGTRGITYELLLSSLKQKLPVNCQKLLISAVISNPDEIRQWFDKDAVLVDGANIKGGYKSLGFVSKKFKYGQIQFANTNNINEGEGFVPRVIIPQQLKKLERETKDRIFPNYVKSKEISLYLALHLYNNGSVALFEGSIIQVSSILKTAIDLHKRNYKAELFNQLANEECGYIAKMYTENFGESSLESMSAELGVLPHHSNIPHGIRIATEHAIREDFVKIVVCTSTLAQGVNLPVRYLLTESVKQGNENITVRDFQNLIGRVGRAGVFTEGTVLFVKPEFIDEYKAKKDYRWERASELLNSSLSEKCTSKLLDIFSPLSTKIDNKFSKEIVITEALNIAKLYIDNEEKFNSKIKELELILQNKKYNTEIPIKQIYEKVRLIKVIENFILEHQIDTTSIINKESNILAHQTLAYYLAEDEVKEKIDQLFKLLEDNINGKIPDLSKRKIFSKTSFGIYDCLRISDWIDKNISIFENLDGTILQTILLELFNLLDTTLKTKFNNISDVSIKIEILSLWISGKPFYEISDLLNANKLKNGRRNYSPMDSVKICENEIAYNADIILSTIVEFLKKDSSKFNNSINCINEFQKILKYGLPNGTSITFYELGFSDRNLAQKLSTICNDSHFIVHPNKSEIISWLKQNSNLAKDTINDYPSYYTIVLNRYLGKEI